ncbi:MAG: S41 family peptidase [Woeseiaceae bacterium]|nr:S41 family peptidase [Woeseiaceae bacterium]
MRRLGAAYLAVILATASVAEAGARALSDEQWRADIGQMSTAIKDIHFKPFHNVTEAAFDNSVDMLLASIADRNDDEIIVAMAEIVAQLGDGHTRVHLPRLYPEFALEAELGHGGTPPPNVAALKLPPLPVRFELFDDGLFVVAAHPDHRGLIGRRVVAFGDTPVGDAIAAVRKVSFTENDSRAKLMAPDRLALPAVLAYLGITRSTTSTRLVTTGVDGVSTVTELRRLNEPDLRFDVGLPDKLPSWQRHRDKYRWYEIRPHDDVIYVQVNQFEEQPKRPYGEFVAETIVAAREAGVSKYVIDLRHNSGGIGAWVTPFVTGLSNSEFNEYGRLFVLTGRTTFSAAQHFLHKFEEFTYAAFVGEPSGAKPSHYGDGRRVVLEHSGISLRISTIYWHSWLANDFRDAINPHIPATLSSADYFAGRDPVLAAAIRYEAPDSLAGQIEEQFRIGATQNALLLFTRFMSDGTRTDHESAIPGLRAMADRIADDGFVRPAFFVYFLANMTYPGDPVTEAGLERLQALQE